MTKIIRRKSEIGAYSVVIERGKYFEVKPTFHILVEFVVDRREQTPDVAAAHCHHSRHGWKSRFSR